jgi:hypothetical protein
MGDRTVNEGIVVEYTGADDTDLKTVEEEAGTWKFPHKDGRPYEET